jgi:hypothetical protein
LEQPSKHWLRKKKPGKSRKGEMISFYLKIELFLLRDKHISSGSYK